MRTHKNYYRIIHSLVSLKEYLLKIESEKYKPLVDELMKYDIDPESDNDHLPSNKNLAEVLNFSQAKTNKLLKDLHL